MMAPRAGKLSAATMAMMGWILAACGGRTSLVPTTDGSPSQHVSDGACPDGFASCGGGSARRCYDLARSPAHCGACGHTCAPGIKCQSSQCQQYRCKGTLSFKALPAVCPNCTGDYLPVLGDFNGDGILDVVGPTGSANGMGLLLGRGDGTFEAYPMASPTTAAWQAAAADLNGDGWLDLASVASGESAVTLRLGNDDPGTHFDPATIYPTSSSVLALLLADLDNDGNVDMVTAADKSLTLWRGSANGKLANSVDIPVGATGSFLASADWNGDGTPDLLYGSSTLRMLLGRGGGTFGQEIACGIQVASASPISTTSGTVVADFDHDQKVDMVAGSARVMLGMNGCNFTTLVDLPATSASAAGAVGVADLDGDENDDIVSCFFAADRKLQVVLGDGHGGFAIPIVLSGTDVSYKATYLTGDLNNDGKLDVFATSPGGWQVFLNACP
ncbi:MAG TPA: FG-GAP-like repeat-containing protein [Polyangia bacterium]